MWRFDTLARTFCELANPGLHIFEKKKPGGCAVLSASSFSKYANPEVCQKILAEGIA